MNNLKVIDLSGILKFDLPESKVIAHDTWFDPKKIAAASEHDFHIAVITDCYHAKTQKLWKFRCSQLRVGLKAPEVTGNYSILKQRMLYLDTCLIKLTGKPADRSRLVIYNLPGVNIKQRTEFLSEKLKQINESFPVTVWNPPAGFNRVAM